MSLHPATRLALFVALAAVISHLPRVFVGVLLVLALLSVRRRQVARLLWRSRWLLLIMFVGYGWALPGEPLMPLYTFWMPSREGLALGAAQSLRLAGMLAALDALLLALEAERLLAGLLVWLQALARVLPGRLCPDPERVALRLWLTLQKIEAGLPPLRGGGLHAAIMQAQQPPPHCATVALVSEPLRVLDGAVLLGLLVGGWAWWALA